MYLQCSSFPLKIMITNYPRQAYPHWQNLTMCLGDTPLWWPGKWCQEGKHCEWRTLQSPTLDAAWCQPRAGCSVLLVGCDVGTVALHLCESWQRLGEHWSSGWLCCSSHLQSFQSCCVLCVYIYVYLYPCGDSLASRGMCFKSLAW